MPKIRRKIVTNFTTVQNDFLRDRSLGFTERGLLVTMLSLPDNWDFSAIGLASIVPDGKAKTYTSLAKLEQKGYLKRSRIYEKGKVSDWLYEFCDMPVFLKKDLVPENREVEKNLVTDFLEVENLEVENLKVENQQDNKILTPVSTKVSISLSNQSINPSEELPENDANNSPKTQKDGLIDVELIEKIKNQIEYDVMKERYGKDLLNAAVSSIAALYTASEPQEFSGATYAPDFIRQRAMALNATHVEYVLNCFNEQKKPIFNIVGYLRTSFFNAPDTMDAYYTNENMAARAV